MSEHPEQISGVNHGCGIDRYETPIFAPAPDLVAASSAVLRSWQEISDERLCPLGLVASGRVGSTLLMRILSSHPGIVTHAEEPFETLIAGHAFRLYYVQTRGGDAEHFNRYAADSRLVGPFPQYMRRNFTDETLNAAIGEAVSGTLRVALANMVTQIYRQLAARYGKVQPTYYAEKTECYAVLGWDHLFGSTKKIVLVRDFRDKFVSTIRYFKQIDPCDGLDPDDQLIKFLKEEFIPGCRYFAHTVSLYRQESLIVRYEDLIRTPDQALRGIVDYLELNEDFGTDLTSLLRYDAGHGTAGSVDKTMGCHLSLPKPLSEILTSNLATELLQFGYS